MVLAMMAIIPFAMIAFCIAAVIAVIVLSLFGAIIGGIFFGRALDFMESLVLVVGVAIVAGLGVLIFEASRPYHYEVTSLILLTIGLLITRRIVVRKRAANEYKKELEAMYRDPAPARKVVTGDFNEKFAGVKSDITTAIEKACKL